MKTPEDTSTIRNTLDSSETEPSPPPSDVEDTEEEDVLDENMKKVVAAVAKKIDRYLIRTTEFLSLKVEEMTKAFRGLANETAKHNELSRQVKVIRTELDLVKLRVKCPDCPYPAREDEDSVIVETG